MKRYTLLTFPSYLGSPRHYRTKIGAWLAAKFCTPFGKVCELKDNQTGEYVPYWTA